MINFETGASTKRVCGRCFSLCRVFCLLATQIIIFPLIFAVLFLIIKQNILCDRLSQVNTPLPDHQATDQTAPDREPIKHLLIGSLKAVKSTIHSLQMLGASEVGAWSPLARTANSNEVMSQ